MGLAFKGKITSKELEKLYNGYISNNHSYIIIKDLKDIEPMYI